LCQRTIHPGARTVSWPPALLSRGALWPVSNIAGVGAPTSNGAVWDEDFRTVRHRSCEKHLRSQGPDWLMATLKPTFVRVYCQPVLTDPPLPVVFTFSWCFPGIRGHRGILAEAVDPVPPLVACLLSSLNLRSNVVCSYIISSFSWFEWMGGAAPVLHRGYGLESLSRQNLVGMPVSGQWQNPRRRQIDGWYQEESRQAHTRQSQTQKQKDRLAFYTAEGWKWSGRPIPRTREVQSH
jgi:hypothetical protein